MKVSSIWKCLLRDIQIKYLIVVFFIFGLESNNIGKDDKKLNLANGNNSDLDQNVKKIKDNISIDDIESALNKDPLIGAKDAIAKVSSQTIISIPSKVISEVQSSKGSNVFQSSTLIKQDSLEVIDTSFKKLTVLKKLIQSSDFANFFDNNVIENILLSSKEGHRQLKMYSDSEGQPFLVTGNSNKRTKRNCYILRLDLNEDFSSIRNKLENILKAIGADILKSYGNLGFYGYHICYPEKELPLTILRGIKGIKWLERDQHFNSNHIQESAPWDLALLNNPTAQLTNEMKYYFNATGKSVTAYVIDSGVMVDHPEFAGRAKLGYSVFKNSSNDCAGHGTQVSSVIAGLNVGVAKEANIIAIQVLDCEGSGENSSVLEALDWIARTATKPAVINMSVGGPKSPSIDEFVRLVVEAGFSIIVAAGNDSMDACLNSPSGVKAATVVGASDSDLKCTSYTNHGPCVDIFASGEKVIAAAIKEKSQKNGYLFASGTSLSAPLVTGIYCLLLQAFPNLTPIELKNRILDAAKRGILDSKTLRGSPNLVAVVPDIPNVGTSDLKFLPPGALPILVDGAYHAESILVYVGIAIAAVLVILIIIILFIVKCRSRRSENQGWK